MKDLVDIFRDSKVADDIWWDQEDYEEDGTEGLTVFDEEDLELGEDEDG